MRVDKEAGLQSRGERSKFSTGSPLPVFLSVCPYAITSSAAKWKVEAQFNELPLAMLDIEYLG
jgi:hypothetical protein